MHDDSLTRSDPDEVWAWLGEVPDPEMPVDLGGRPRHRARCRAGTAMTLVVDDHADLFRLPGHQRHRPRHRDGAARAKGIEKLRSSGSSRRPGRPTGSAGRTASGCRPTASRRRSRTARRRPSPVDRFAARKPSDDRLPALRFDAHGNGQRVRLDARARRSTAAATASSPSTTSSAFETSGRSMTTFYPLTVADVRRETRDAIVAHPRRAARAQAMRFRFTQGST